jgi:hypothetical protein
VVGHRQIFDLARSWGVKKPENRGVFDSCIFSTVAIMVMGTTFIASTRLRILLPKGEGTSRQALPGIFAPEVKIAVTGSKLVVRGKIAGDLRSRR